MGASGCKHATPSVQVDADVVQVNAGVAQVNAEAAPLPTAHADPVATQPQVVAILDDGLDQRIADALEKHMSPVNFISMALKVKHLMHQRLLAARMHLQEEKDREKDLKAEAKARRGSNVALDEISLSVSVTYQAISAGLKSYTTPEREAGIRDGLELLVQRLTFAGLEQQIMEGDGNCQVRRRPASGRLCGRRLPRRNKPRPGPEPA